MLARNDTRTDDLDDSTEYPTATQIKAAIPNHVFKSSLLTSIYYVIKDFAIISVLYLTMLKFENQLSWTLLCVIFPLYWILQGTMFMAIFVVGHDCGHGSFSKYGVINDVIGSLLHSFVLTPFYPWKLSHRNHHKNTGNMDKDEVFYPVRESENNGKGFIKLFGLGFGWFIYLIKGYSPRSFSHFNPYSDLFVKHVSACFMSVLLLIGWMWFLSYYASIFGAMNLIKYYVIPELIFATWLLVVTFLHHTDVNVPWYSSEFYTFVNLS